VFIGPYEHHSNELPWRESIATWWSSKKTPTAVIDLETLERALQEFAAPAPADRQLLGGEQRHRHRQPHPGQVASCCTGTERFASGTSPPPART
jgi:hypothetical protein